MTTRRRHRRAGYILTFFVLVTLGWAARCAQLSRAAYRDLRTAQQHLAVVRDADALRALANGDSLDLPLAQRALHRAYDRLTSPWLWPAYGVPVANNQLRSAVAITSTTMSIVDIATDAGSQLAPERRASLSRSQQLDVTAVLARRLQAIVAGPDLGPTSSLAPPLARARAQLVEQLDRIRPGVEQLTDALPGLQAVAAGPRRYLVVAANNAEMAAGSGLPLAVATVDIVDGTPTFGQWKWSGDLPLPGDGATLSPEMKSLWGFASPEGDLRRAIVSPRFTTTAPLLASQYELATGDRVDGVALIDIVGLQKIVAASGGATASGLPATQIIPELLHDQYIAIDGTIVGSHAEREEKLSGQSSEAASLLLSPDTDLLKLGRGLADGIAGRHVLLWSRSPLEQQAFAALGADGELTDQSVMVNLQNVASNKLDWFTRLSSSLTVERTASGDQHVTVEVTIVNTVPANEPAYVAGPSSAARRYGQYVGYLTLHAPAGATDIHLGSASPIIVQGIDGPSQVIGQIVAIDINRTSKVTFHFTVPASTKTLTVEPSARFPAVAWTSGDEQWTDDRGHRITLSV